MFDARLVAATALSFGLAGCQTILGIEDPVAGTPSNSDASAIDATGNGVDAGFCAWPLPPLNFDTCADAPRPTSPLDLPAGDTYFLDTTARTLVDSGGTPIPILAADVPLGNGTMALLVSVTSFTLPDGADMAITGDRPVIIMAEGVEGQVSSGTITIAGNMFLNGQRSGPIAISGPGGGADPECDSLSSGRISVDAEGGGGGGGGGFGFGGGDGGSGGGNLMNPAGLAGAVSLNPSLDPLRGGCPGGVGADFNAGGTAPGGGAGGAIQLAARDLISIQGSIEANGGGGFGGSGMSATGGAGAGGGGSGGGILLDSSAIEVTPSGRLCANGGSGGEGGRNGQTGAAGLTGLCADAPADPIEINGNGGGEAGNGGHASSPDGRPGMAAASLAMEGGGGGGGGGVGVIHFHTGGAPTIQTGSVITPNELLDLP